VRATRRRCARRRQHGWMSMSMTIDNTLRVRRVPGRARCWPGSARDLFPRGARPASNTRRSPPWPPPHNRARPTSPLGSAVPASSSETAPARTWSGRPPSSARRPPPRPYERPTRTPLMHDVHRRSFRHRHGAGDLSSLQSVLPAARRRCGHILWCAAGSRSYLTAGSRRQCLADLDADATRSVTGPRFIPRGRRLRWVT
jgi:hypothetical protein